MKKAASIFLVLLLTFVLLAPLTASALTKDDVVNEVRAGFPIGNQTKYMPSEYVRLIENYMTAYPLTQEQLEWAIEDLQEVKKIWGDTGIFAWDNLPTDVQNLLISKAEASAKKVGATLMHDGRKIWLVGPEGKKVTGADDQPIKQTGGDSSAAILLTCAVLLILCAAVVIARKMRLGSRETAVRHG